MSTPLDKCGYMFTESYGPQKHYRLVLGFENLDDLHAAQDFVTSLRQKSPTQETVPAPEASIQKAFARSPRRVPDDRWDDSQDLTDRDANNSEPGT